MAAGAWKIYEVSKKQLFDGTFDLDDTTNWKIALFSSTSNVNTLALAAPIYGNATNEVSNGNGYTTGGLDITGVSLTQSGATVTFTCSPAVWTASGAGFSSRFAVIYKNATVNSVIKPMLLVCLLDVTPADVTVTAGNTLTITMNASGIFNVTGANVD